MAGAMREVVPVAALRDHRTCRIVHLGASESVTALRGVTHERDRAVPGVPNRQPDPARLVVRLSHRRHPGLIGIDAAFLARPEIDEQNLTSANRTRMTRRWLVMWIRRVLTRGDVRAVIGGEPASVKLLEDPPHQLVLGDRVVSVRPTSRKRQRVP